MLPLDYRDARPIYEQIKQALRRLVFTHAIAADEKLPSVRELAALLAINPNTIQRAYHELEAEGYLYSIPGKGTFAAEGTAVCRECRQELLSQFDELITELLFISVSPDELTDRIQTLAEREVLI